MQSVSLPTMPFMLISMAKWRCCASMGLFTGSHATGSRTQAGSVSPTPKLRVSELLLKRAHALLSDDGHSSLQATRPFNCQRGHGTALSRRRPWLSTARHTANPQRSHHIWLNTAQSCSATCVHAQHPFAQLLSLCPGKMLIRVE